MADPSTHKNPSPAEVPASVNGVLPSSTEPHSVSPPSAAASRSALLIVFLVVFIDLLGFGIVLPLLPIYGDLYVHRLIEGGKDSPLGGAIVGLIMSAFSLMQFLGAPIWGRISDRIGRRPVLLVGLAGSVFFYFLFGIASDLPPDSAAGLALALIFVSRIGAGVAGATIATAQAVIADCTPPEKRKHGMALIGAAFGIGFTFGPLVGFAALHYFPDYRGAIGYSAAFLSLVALVLGWILLPETRRPDSTSARRKWLDWPSIGRALRSPAIGPVILVFFLASLGFGSFEVTLAMLNRDILGVKNQQNFLIFAYVGVVLMVTQGGIYRRLARRVTEVSFMTAGILFMGVGVLSLGGVTVWATHLAGETQRTAEATSLAEGQLADFWTLLPWQLTALTLCVVGFALLTPSAQALVSRRTAADRQGEILGVNQSFSALARILGPVLGLTLYKATANHLLPYLAGGILLLSMLPLIPRIRRFDQEG